MNWGLSLIVIYLVMDVCFALQIKIQCYNFILFSLNSASFGDEEIFKIALFVSSTGFCLLGEHLFPVITIYSRSILCFPAPLLKLAISLRNLDFLYHVLVLIIKIRVLGLLTYGSVTLSRFLSWQSKELHMCILTTHKHMQHCFPTCSNCWYISK